MDPRINVYGEEIYREWEELWNAPEAFLPYLDRHGVDFVLLVKRERNRAFVERLTVSPEWYLAKELKRRVLYVRDEKASGVGSAKLGNRSGRGVAPSTGEQGGF
jgi:hypothetical protein